MVLTNKKMNRLTKNVSSLEEVINDLQRYQLNSNLKPFFITFHSNVTIKIKYSGAVEVLETLSLLQFDSSGALILWLKLTDIKVVEESSLTYSAVPI